MKILVVSNVQTYPITSGSAKFISDYCSLLKSMGHDVYFLHVTYCALTKIGRVKIEESSLTTCEKWGDHYFRYQMTVWDKLKEILTSFYHKYVTDCYAGCDNRYAGGLHHYVEKLNRIYHFDACLVNYYWLTKLLTKVKIPRRGIITHDSFTFNNLRNNVTSLLNLTPSEEAKALQRCPTIFAMQDEEAILFKRLAPKSKVLVSYCNYEYVKQPIIGNHNLLFLSGGFYLNVNGLKWFVENVFPSILDVFPDCRLKIGGAICDFVEKCGYVGGVDLIGYVDSPADFYALGDVAINPTYQGTGLKIKTFEAMAYDKVTMVHPHSINGIFDKDKAPIFSSDQPSEWLAFLRKIWGDHSNISVIKRENHNYISRMNDFIKSQFEEFLK
ncbi:glycosyltransferase family 4 protein [Bacteroides cellulosilyticus]|jgi:hypothetical protein|uniref:glycosyltransferase n=1 Tax=Bacteroides cellulosilyticus TaxID=246787 RepID=UPI00234C88B0|nr:glycosyltransferase family 4 protein [Bacteroides cellulosilyticus]MDC7179083.1 glycosyltransferase family 4 protein [Bacteroides cellulosilyticus]MDC7179911.1 glycosyltransferase family 4 protein [Bacteroides cellulosilyticus]